MIIENDYQLHLKRSDFMEQDEPHSISQLIQSRRTIRKILPDAIPLELIYTILEIASFAPFHSKKEPWEVLLISTESERQLFSTAILESYTRLGVWDSYDQSALDKTKRKVYDYFAEVPVSIVVSVPLEADQKTSLEAISATAAFIQNIQLVAWDKSIGVTWRTTPNIFDSKFAEELRIDSTRQIVATLHLTKIKTASTKIKAKRTPLSEWVTTLESVRNNEA